MKPHTLTVNPVQETKSGDVIESYTFGSAITLRGQVSEKTSERAFRDFGHETSNPAYLMLDVDDSASVKPGDKVTVNGRVYYVQAGPKINDAHPAMSYALYLVERAG